MPKIAPHVLDRYTLPQKDTPDPGSQNNLMVLPHMIDEGKEIAWQPLLVETEKSTGR